MHEKPATHFRRARNWSNQFSVTTSARSAPTTAWSMANELPSGHLRGSCAVIEARPPDLLFRLRRSAAGEYDATAPGLEARRLPLARPFQEWLRGSAPVRRPHRPRGCGVERHPRLRALRQIEDAPVAVIEGRVGAPKQHHAPAVRRHARRVVVSRIRAGAASVACPIDQEESGARRRGGATPC